MEQSPAATAQELAFNRQALISAISTGDTETVVKLLDGGVPIATKNDEGMYLLHWAAQSGHVITVRLLIRRGCHVDSVDARGVTPLHCAAAIGQTKAVQELIRNGASKLVVGGVFGTPLHQAALYGHVETAVAMLEEGCPLEVYSSDGIAVLHFAAAGGNVELVRQLVSRGCNVNGVAANGFTPLHAAAACGITEAVYELIKLGASKSPNAGNGGTPLHQAVLKGHIETAVAMLEEGCPPEVVDSDGETVLHWAAAGGNVDLIRELVVRGCNVNAVKVNGCTPLHVAAAHGKTEAICELVQLGAAKAVVAGICGTPLHEAVLYGHVETTVAMLEERFPNDIVNSTGATILHWAAAAGNVEIVRELVGRGCNLNAVKPNGCTPLHVAAGCGRTEVVRELIKLGASKSVVAGNYGTPLHQAAIKGHVETAVAMLEEGCPYDIVNSAGATVLHWAAAGGHVNIIRELVARMCDINAEHANGCTPLHSAALCGRIEAVRELIKLGAAKSIVAGLHGTPLHQAVFGGHVEAVEALLEEDVLETDLASNDIPSLKTQVLDSGIIGICDSFHQTPVMWALRCGQVDVLKLLISKGGAISGRDTHLLSVFEHCFISGQAYKLKQFCEACSIRSSGEGLKGILATLVARGLVDAHKVLCLCAISGDNILLDDTFVELVASDACVMSAAVNCVKYCFQKGEGNSFISQLSISDENALNPLHMALLSLKCYKMGYAIHSVHRGAKDHTSFITKLLSHSVLKKTVHDNFPNGLSPLDLARQFELHHIAALIEVAGGRPGVWAGVPQEIAVRHPLALLGVKEAYASIKAIAEDGELGHIFIKHLLSSVLSEPLSDRPTLHDAGQSSKDGILREKPTLPRLARLIMTHVSAQNWRLIGLLLLEDIADVEGTLNAISHQYSDDRNKLLETLSYWLEHGSSVTWNTLLDVLGCFETKHTVDELTSKIVSVLGGGHQVNVCVLCGVLRCCAAWCLEEANVIYSPVMCACVCAASSSLRWWL